MLRSRIRLFVKVARNIILVFVLLFLVYVYNEKKNQIDEITNMIIKSGMEHIFLPTNITTETMNESEIASIILKLNMEEKMLNEEIYGPIQKDTVIMVILVHKSSLALKFMLLSLSKVKGIQEALLIFSHSYYDEKINALIRTIDFCRVLQIFYPHSLQLHPHKFPGTEPGDCPYYVNVKYAEYLNCSSAPFYDIHGYYRNPQLAEKKHHWWWTANQVFENLTCTEGHVGIVVFFTDNYFLMEDFLYMTIYMKNIASSISRCEFLSLATLSDAYPYDKQSDAVEVMSWEPARHSDVLAFDLSVWNSLVSHYDLFCFIDDNSWAESLSYLSLNRRDGGRYRVMSSMFPRAYKPYSCMFFGKNMNCDAFASVHQIMSLQKLKNDTAFPPHVGVYVDIELEDEYLGFDYVESNGGWNDPRDKSLCHNMTISKIKKEILDMNNQFQGFVGY